MSKKRGPAIRVNSDIPSLSPVQVRDYEGRLIEYQLLSIHFIFRVSSTDWSQAQEIIYSTKAAIPRRQFYAVNFLP